MTQSIKVSKILAAIAVIAFVVFVTFTFVAVSKTQAYGDSGCGSCGGGDVTGGGGGDGGGDNTPNPPSCDISTNLTMVNVGQTYRISWTGTVGATYRLVNDTSSLAVDPTGWYEFTWDANDAMVMYELRGQNAGGTCSDIVEVYRSVTAPTCDITANISVVQDGGQFIISWNGTPNHSTAFRVNGTMVDAVDSATYTFPVGRTTPAVFTMTGQNAAGSCTDTVSVYPASNPPTPLPTCTLTANPTSIVNGGSSVLSWTTTNATSISINQGIGAVTGTSRSVSPTTNTTYTMTVTNGTGSATCAATVNVTPVVPEAPRCDNFDANPITINRGQSSVLSWNTTNATAATINNGVGSVAVDGSKTVSPLETTTYTMTLTGVNNQTATCARTVTVVQPNTVSCANNVNFSASPKSLPYGGGNTTLTWSTTGLTSVAITDIANPGLSGSAAVSLKDDKTYTLTGTANGQTINCPLSIDVAEKSGGGGGGSSAIKCTLKISDKSINAGDEVTLTWTTTRADEITLKDNHGNVIVKNTDDKDDLDSSIKVRPTKDTTYTLLAEKGSRDKTCKVEVDVKSSVVASETRVQLPTVAGIALTQVPYTGFEAGPVLTTIFYALLTIWGLFVAYVVAVRRDIIGGISLAGAHTHVPYKEVSTEAVGEESPADAYVKAAITEAPTNLPTGIAPVIGYVNKAAITDEEIDASIEMTELENRAHAEKALFSSDAMRAFVAGTKKESRIEDLDALIEKAKSSFPSEDGWIIIDTARLGSLMTAPTAEAATAVSRAGNGGSLAEAIVTGNVVAAYQLIAHRPMIALADAASELDTVVRARRGDKVTLSTMLEKESARLSDEQLSAAIKALTGALDGVYNSEEEAVKMAIMKAVKVLA